MCAEKATRKPILILIFSNSKERDISVTQWALIRYLKDNGPATFSDVADYWQNDYASD
ncbi:hypothetical protein [Brevibacillus brevis]|uniref:hypothetical protein n=1 Tax=Brevibacillus brevis TaxID=1393 RepID=UPI0025A658E3|nr:hypothetical protein [Brevibacillus brevis]WJQ84349.1 hypothetical protein QN310_14890 [Brevibacillus brevis]